MTISGTVTSGNRIGRRLGFPTANLIVAADLAVEDGVYTAKVTLDGRTYCGMACVGYKPTVGGPRQRMLEVNLFDFEQDIYGRQIEVELLDYIRPEHRFDSLDALKEQIIKDKEQVLCTLTKNYPTR